jgi:magnesium chelatase family protein
VIDWKSSVWMVVKVEVATTNGLPGIDIVGLPDAAVKELRESVRAAIKNAGLSYPVNA